MIQRTLQRFAICVALNLPWFGTQQGMAQPPLCFPHQVNPTFANVYQEPHDKAIFVDVLEAGDIVCVNREGPFGGSQWGHVIFRVRHSPGERTPVDGWVPMKHLSPMPRGTLAIGPQSLATRQIPSSPDPYQAGEPARVTPTDDIIRFDQPVPFGPFPINGRTLKELSEAIPMFPPVKEAENSLWEKSCPACHKWEQQTLCKQGEIYLANPRNALRHPHPFGGPFKVALMRWAKNGCQ